MLPTHDLNDMMVFLAVVETGSFTLAAERLGMPKANVSRKVSRLEEKLGVILLERSTRSQHLTEAGKRYVQHCKRIHEEIDLAQACVSEMLHRPKGQLTVGCSVSIGQQLLKPVLADFMRQYPEINLQLSLMNRRVDLIEEGFDLLIRVGELDDSRLIGKRLGQVSRRLFASPDYVHRRGMPQNISELQDGDLLHMSQMGSHQKIVLTSSGRTERLTSKPRLLVDDFPILIQSVIDGLGIAVLPEYMCREALTKGEMIPVLPQWGMDDVDIYALYPQHRAKIPKVSVFLEFIQGVFSKGL